MAMIAMTTSNSISVKAPCRDRHSTGLLPHRTLEWFEGIAVGTPVARICAGGRRQLRSQPRPGWLPTLFPIFNPRNSPLLNLQPIKLLGQAYRVGEG
jgi:hypothetical protein